MADVLASRLAHESEFSAFGCLFFSSWACTLARKAEAVQGGQPAAERKSNSALRVYADGENRSKLSRTLK
jgi:hypothetical protein